VPELVALAGGLNLFGAAGKHSPWMSWEELCDRDPDVIVALPCGFDLERTRVEMSALTCRPEWTTLSAVRNGRVFITDGNQFFNRPGPRMVESLEILAEVFIPRCFGLARRVRVGPVDAGAIAGEDGSVSAPMRSGMNDADPKQGTNDFDSQRTLPQWHGDGPLRAPQSPTSDDVAAGLPPAPTPRPLPLSRVAEYQLLEEIGRGGMGVVFKARHVRLGRVVALKMILGGALAHADDLHRFHTEEEAAAQLQHPNIVALYEAGIFENQPYFAME